MVPTPPFFAAIAFSFSDVTAGDPSFDWVGLANFQAIFRDAVFWRSLLNTLVFTAISMARLTLRRTGWFWLHPLSAQRTPRVTQPFDVHLNAFASRLSTICCSRFSSVRMVAGRLSSKSTSNG